MSTPLVFHQSDLAAFSRCAQQVKLRRDGRPGTQGSAAAYGSVLHHAAAVLRRTGELDKARATFDFYWHPQNISAICDPVPADGWQGKHSYGSLRKRGLETLDGLAREFADDTAETLALEYDFVMPFPGTPWYVAGQLDGLSARFRKRKLELHIEDLKSGAQKYGLRWNAQGTMYVFATTQRPFWVGHDPIELRRFGTNQVRTYAADGFGERGPQLHDRFADAPRRFLWANVSTARPRWVDGGYRAQQDFDRLRLALSQLAQVEQADIWPLRLDGEVCMYCAVREHCGDVPPPPETYGDPFAV